MEFGDGAPLVVPGTNPAWPSLLHIIGRNAARGNADICGEYVLVGTHAGLAAYQQAGGRCVIRYHPGADRWLVDRDGFNHSDTCVAYADNLAGAEHPGHVDIQWHVWEKMRQIHVVDGAVVCLDAPTRMTLVGRATDRENSGALGDYTLCGACHGRALYRQIEGHYVLRYHQPENRWLLAENFDGNTNICAAFADAGNSPHPGYAELLWHFWEPSLGYHEADPMAKVMAVPIWVHVLGRSPELENDRICGSYQLAGVHEGRPVYVQQGTKNAIRYSRISDRWLIDCEGLSKPSLKDRLKQWISNGAAGDASERCSAYAEARGTEHPGCVRLEWQVWETRSGRHVPDSAVRATTAPTTLTVSGRAAGQENEDMNGEYVLVGTHMYRPAYQKLRGRFAIRFWPPMDRWVLDREGLRCSDVCVAYADSHAGAEHPACVRGGTWHVFDSSRGRHLLDPGLSVEVSPSEKALESAATTAAIQAAAWVPPRPGSWTTPRLGRGYRAAPYGLAQQENVPPQWMQGISVEGLRKPAGMAAPGCGFRVGGC